MSHTRREPRSKPEVREEESTRQAADMAALRRMLVASQGCFSLSFAVCNDRTLRNELVQRLQDEFPDIALISLSPQTRDVYQVVSDRLAATTPAAVFVLDVEASLPFEAGVYPTLRALNSSRELWERFACPVVFWLAEYAATLVARQAPDFWRYRSHQFEFVSERASVDQALAEPFPGFEMVDGLPVEEKRFRITELEQRLNEAGAEPSAELLPHALLWLYELAHLYRHANQFDQAIDLLEQAVRWTESAYGRNNADTATALNNLAQLLQATNRLAEAEPLMRRALAIDEHVFGQEHPNVARDLNNLALLLQATNRLAEAEPLARHALAIDERSFGREDPKVAIRLNNLAAILRSANRLAEAEPLMARVVFIIEKHLGRDHPNIATALNNLAALLQATNRLAEAEPLMRRALAVVERSFGTKHPNVAIALNNLAVSLKATNRLAEAEPLMRRALGILTASLGDEHPAKRNVEGNYMRLLSAMGRTEAEIRASLDAVRDSAA